MRARAGVAGRTGAREAAAGGGWAAARRMGSAGPDLGLAGRRRGHGLARRLGEGDREARGLVGGAENEEGLGRGCLKCTGVYL